ncbi:MAG: hypothetical protein MJY70_04385 [Bacteroidales bacterium]|nr:hypothetical protein [Bacteroidales bacterium]
MRIFNLTTLAVLILFLSSGCQSPNSKTNKTTNEPVIFAINTEDIEYFADEQGSFLFGKQFDYVSAAISYKSIKNYGYFKN